MSDIAGAFLLGAGAGTLFTVVVVPPIALIVLRRAERRQRAGR